MRPPAPAPARNPGRDDNDHRRLRHARDRHAGFPVGRYLQPPPLLFTRDGHNVFLGDMYRGHAAFLVCGGPSLLTHDLSLLDQRGILTMAVNNAAAVLRPRLWTSVDDPSHFCDAIWQDAGVIKLVPLDHMEKPVHVRDPGGALVPSPRLVGDMPGVFGFRRNEDFRPDQWLYEDTFNWGNRSDLCDADGHKGSRSVFYVALRLLFFLGVRTVYLVGCDFRMDVGRPNYAFEQDRSPGSVRGNNSTYRVLNTRLARLKPHFDAEGFRVVNCTPDSGLVVFPRLGFDAAVREARAHMPDRIVTAGMYDGTARPPAPATLPLTLVTYVTPETMRPLRTAWRGWMRHAPWLAGLTKVVCHGPGVDPADRGCRWLRRAPAVHFERYPGDDPSPDALRRWAVLDIAPRRVTTPWAIVLDPGARMTPGGDGVDPDWFVPSSRPMPSCVTHPGPPIPASTLARLDEWSGGPAAAGCQRPSPPDTRAIGGAAFFARVEWLRDLTRAASAPGEVATDDLLGYLAARRADPVALADFARTGWVGIGGGT